MNAINHMLRDEEAATAIEYGVIAGMVTILLVALLGSNSAFSQALTQLYENVGAELGKVIPAP